MKTILENNFKPIYNFYEDVFISIKKASEKYDFQFFLIGAQLRDIWINHLNLKKRETEDIDLTMCLGDLNDFDKIIYYLVDEKRFERDHKLPYRLYLNNKRVDLIPYNIKTENDSQILSNNIELSTEGFPVALSDFIELSNGIKILTLPSLCILKLISYNDKPYAREKDLNDFLLILKYFGDIFPPILFEETNIELLTKFQDSQIAGIHILGRMTYNLLEKDISLRIKIKRILSNIIENYSEIEIESMFTEKMTYKSEDSKYKFILEFLKEFA